MLEALAAGDEVVLTRYGKPVAKIVPTTYPAMTGARIYPPTKIGTVHTHDWIQVTTMGDPVRRYLCTICGQKAP